MRKRRVWGLGSTWRRGGGGGGERGRSKSWGSLTTVPQKTCGLVQPGTRSETEAAARTEGGGEVEHFSEEAGGKRRGVRLGGRRRAQNR